MVSVHGHVISVHVQVVKYMVMWSGYMVRWSGYMVRRSSPLRELIARLAVAVRMNEAELVVERNER